jgi:DNA-binding winged helix-turn-helix (wHTH) protein
MTQPLRFGSTEVRPAERQLLIDGQQVFIGARAFDVLHLLITHRERVVGKNELLEAVWPGLVVEENNLQVQISALRKILGAGAITTVAGQGYQFTAMLDSERDTLPGAGGPLSVSTTQFPAGQRAALGVPVEPAAPVPRPAVAARGTRLALGVAIGLAIGIGAWAVLRTKPEVAIVATTGTNVQTAPRPLGCRAALCEYERRSHAGLFFGRPVRGVAQFALEHPRSPCGGAHILVHL